MGARVPSTWVLGFLVHVLAKAEVTYLIVSQALPRHYLRPRRKYLFWVKGHSGASRQLLKTLVYL